MSDLKSCLHIEYCIRTFIQINDHGQPYPKTAIGAHDTRNIKQYLATVFLA